MRVPFDGTEGCPEIRMAGTSVPSAEHTPRVVSRPAQIEDRCRCGNRIPPGAKCLEIVDVPRTLADWIQGRSFCGPACVRAYLLESMEPLESAVGGQELIASLQGVIRSLDERATASTPSLRSRVR